MRKLSLAPRGKGVNAARLGFALRGAGRLEALFGSPESNDGFGSSAVDPRSVRERQQWVESCHSPAIGSGPVAP